MIGFSSSTENNNNDSNNLWLETWLHSSSIITNEDDVVARVDPFGSCLVADHDIYYAISKL